jgi:hypothetical protein
MRIAVEQHYDRVLAEIGRYNPRWYDAMHVVDLATWLRNWNESVLLRLYAEALAAKKAAASAWELAHAAKIAQAAYVAMDPEDVRKALTDPVIQALVESLSADRRAGLPPYNTDGGQPA